MRAHLNGSHHTAHMARRLRHRRAHLTLHLHLPASATAGPYTLQILVIDTDGQKHLITRTVTLT
ncbi:MAG TPA: hypothetical protein VGY97_13135 [Solirubrobacteraceae bacterium]|nr:hypothetical protein [Solirubrobacteraceae bacterium]